MSLPEAVAHLKLCWERFFETVSKPATCLLCQGSGIAWNGCRLRSASVLVEGTVHHLTGIPCRRLKCGDCRKSWTLRPPGLAPHKHYQLCVVAGATSTYLFEPDASRDQVASDHDCDRRTLGRWLEWLPRLLEPARLQQMLLALTEQPVLAPLREVLELNRKARGEHRQQALVKAAENLSLTEALAVAAGQEPPGLRSILEALLANRPRLATYASPAIPDFARRHMVPQRGTLAM